MSHPLVRTTEAFLMKNLQLSGAGMSSTISGGKGVKGGKNKREGGKVGQKQSERNNTTTVDNEASAVKEVEPSIVLFISLSGGKFIFCLFSLFTDLNSIRPLSTTHRK